MTTSDEWRDAMLASWADDLWDEHDDDATPENKHASR
jgi:hypothetical protein